MGQRINKKEKLAQVRKIKREKYGGKCAICGAPTSGTGPNKPPPRCCAKHRKESWAIKRAEEIVVESNSVRFGEMEKMKLPEGFEEFHLRKCECGHPRLSHYDEHLFCTELECKCEGFQVKDLDPGGRDSFA